jgi:hypothetical protein
MYVRMYVCMYVWRGEERERREQRGFVLQSVSIIEEIGLLNTITAMRQYRRGSSSCLEGCGTRSKGFLFFVLFFCFLVAVGYGEWGSGLTVRSGGFCVFKSQEYKAVAEGS